jgi:hypothetical protein
LRSLCQSSAVAENKLGADVARLLLSRLADLRAAGSFGELIGLLPMSVDDAAGKAVIALGASSDTVFHIRVNHPNCPRHEDGAVDWQRVTRIQILRIEVPA